MAACSRVQLDNREDALIRFQVARYGTSQAATKAPLDYKDGYQAVPFGAYAWYKGATPAYDQAFMTNEKVAYNATENIWFTEQTTYYWPKSGTLDFICYSPYSTDGVPQVEEDRIEYSAWNVSANPGTDLLYADKATGLNQNKTTYFYSGVPVLFRHALAKVEFSMRLAYSEMVPSTGDKTKWEVTLKSITLKDILTTGSLTLNLVDGQWALPDSKVWTATGARTDVNLDCSALQVFKDTEPQNLGESMLVLPQALDNGQKMVLKLAISTWRDTGEGYPQEPFIEETEILLNASLTTQALQKWGINQSIKYNLILAPSLSPDGVSPTEITFDPAEADWDTVTLNAVIDI